MPQPTTRAPAQPVHTQRIVKLDAGTIAPGLAPLFEQAEALFYDLRRAVAGHTTLSRALDDAGKDKQPGQPRKGLPLLMFKATIDGVNTIDVTSDMERPSFDRRYAQHALVPHIDAYYTDIVGISANLVELLQHITMLYPDIEESEAQPGAPQQ